MTEKEVVFQEGWHGWAGGWADTGVMKGLVGDVAQVRNEKVSKEQTLPKAVPSEMTKAVDSMS